MVYYSLVPDQRDFLWYKCVWESAERLQGLLHHFSSSQGDEGKDEQACEERGDTHHSTVFQLLANVFTETREGWEQLETGTGSRRPKLMVVLRKILRRRLIIHPGSGMTCHHIGSIPGKGPSLSRWRAPQSGHGSVPTAEINQGLTAKSVSSDSHGILTSRPNVAKGIEYSKLHSIFLYLQSHIGHRGNDRWSMHDLKGVIP